MPPIIAAALMPAEAAFRLYLVSGGVCHRGWSPAGFVEAGFDRNVRAPGRDWLIGMALLELAAQAIALKAYCSWHCGVPWARK